ncbi:acetate--CoA ligase family protein [Marivita sp. S0852]|uniref:acetate--CoA ligase family protein n=1 Tax=Marivita sp. S0852 TaxID=3373893 RepID=UPI003982C418
MADGAEARGLRFAPITPAQDVALADRLGTLVTRTNPLDYHTFIWDDADKMAEVYTIMARGSAALTVVFADFPRADRCQTVAWRCVQTACVAAREASGTPIAVLASLPENMPEDMAVWFMTQGILPLNGLEAGLEALAALYSDRPQADVDRDILVPCCQTKMTLLDEADAKRALSAFGADIPRHAIADSPDHAATGSETLLPVVLKTRGLAHKSESGGVVLGLDTLDAVRAAATRMHGSSYYIEEMVTDGLAELLVAVIADPAHGYILTLGAGGVLTELWRDTQHLLLPATEAEVDAALSRLRSAPVLSGYRGGAACDRSSVLRAVMAVQDYVIAQDGRVAEVEVNPLIVTPTRAVIADALIRREV